MEDFIKEKDPLEMETFKEKEEAAMKRKIEGNDYFNKNMVPSAIRKYTKALEIFSYEGSLSEKEKEFVRKEIKLPCYLNLAASHVKNLEHQRVVEFANKALEIDPKSLKGLWRKGCALTELGEWDNAKKSFTDGLAIEPDNKALKSSLAHLIKLITEKEKMEKLKFRNVFQKLADTEDY